LKSVSKEKKASPKEALEALPDHFVGEIIHGEVTVSPRPSGIQLLTEHIWPQLGQQVEHQKGSEA